MSYDCLKIDHQLCFPLYAVSHQMTKKYKPFLDALDLTYPQYLTMMVLWEKGDISVKDLGEVLYLDSGTLTPLLKRLEAKGYVTRTRSTVDERSVNIALTDEGKVLEERAKDVPHAIGSCVPLDEQEAQMLYHLLYKILHEMK